MIEFMGNIIGRPLLWLNSWTGNFALSVVLFLVASKFFLSFLDYYKTIKKVRGKVAKPFLFKIKEKYLGKDSEKFEKGSLEIFKLTKISQFSVALPTTIEFLIILSILNVLYNPISVLFGNMAAEVPDLHAKAIEIVAPGISQEIDVLNAIKINPSVFTGIDTQPITAINTDILGFNILHPAELWAPSMIMPIIVILYFIYRILKVAIPVVQKKVKLRNVVLPLSLYILTGCTMSVAAFNLPLIFYLYFCIHTLLGILSKKIIDIMVAKRYKAWVEETNTKCQQVLKKYEIEETVSAIGNEEGDNYGEEEND